MIKTLLILTCAILYVLCDASKLSWESKDIIRRQRFIAKAFSTRSAISLATTTTTVPLTCALSQAVAGSCLKRRHRKSNLMNLKIQEEEFRIQREIDGSKPENSKNELFADKVRNAKLAFTIWRTTTSTYTITTTSTNSALTFSVSFLCSINGVGVPGLCG